LFKEIIRRRFISLDQSFLFLLLLHSSNLFICKKYMYALAGCSKTPPTMRITKSKKSIRRSNAFTNFVTKKKIISL